MILGVLKTRRIITEKGAKTRVPSLGLVEHGDTAGYYYRL